MTQILRELADEVDLEPGPLEDKIIIESGFSAGAYGQADQRTEMRWPSRRGWRP